MISAVAAAREPLPTKLDYFEAYSATTLPFMPALIFFTSMFLSSPPTLTSRLVPWWLQESKRLVDVSSELLAAKQNVDNLRRAHADLLADCAEVRMFN